MKTFVVVVICLAACAFAVYEVVGFAKDLKDRKTKKENLKKGGGLNDYNTKPDR